VHGSAIINHHIPYSHGLHSTQVDYVNAYCQAPLNQNEELYMELPRGYKFDTKEDCVLKLKKSFYGLKQARLNWFLHLQDSLLNRGFSQSELDPCLFYSEKVIILIYVDDAILFAKDKSDIDAVLQSLETDFNFTNEGDFETYLGVQVKQLDNDKNGKSRLSLTQPQLINKIIKALDLENANIAPTPATILLTKDENSDKREGKWHYCSVIGMFRYLQQTTRPDISFAVHQCARFCNDPKKSHEAAVKRIGRYLLGTKDKGIIFDPKNPSFLDCYVDADFAGLYKAEDPKKDQLPLFKTE